ncbi:hypothetical protein P691DRAFT_763528 [Macrolepiota fuliginosa MF-IS2]|uniref:Uncharacterized protein n=1 Tax=Macrolepiota fuliginosa MF-IS2 TaxID=1400762 RepID=A0A9P6C058_9AGAR|nr:hypothetical protein P691DRAFT_763528 [Macrolepiota fuliginosa MF-IS2]
MQHAYTGAVLSNGYAMLALNITRQSSLIGASYSLGFDTSTEDNSVTSAGTAMIGNMNPLPSSYLNFSAWVSDGSSTLCQGYDGEDIADGTKINVNCGIFLGPPQRTDDGDPQDYAPGSRWSQKIHSCASATRASIQTVKFSTNGTTDLQGLHITRTLGGLNVLWATEKTNLTIADLNILWGRLPTTQLYGRTQNPTTYSGGSDFAIRLKFQSLVAQDPVNGNAQIRNLVWTDQMANNFIGTQTNDTLWVAEYMKSIQYDFRYAIPGFALLLIWVPSFLVAIFLLITRSLTFGYMKKVINHTSVGRVVVGASNLRIRDRDDDQSNFVRPKSDSTFVAPGDDSSIPGRSQKKNGWGPTTPVTLELGHKSGGHEDGNELEPLNRG